ncbi:type II secretion system protein [Granulicella aggregans]|uniref:type II secretion system protein n=1 Tax=Granulicella aggregans TaxID=474949 RepID=UPI0021DFD26F|nr:type II secretion system protein [Granulicella aggregans]
MPRENPAPRDARDDEQGFLLLGVIVMVALLLIFLSVAAPIVAKDLQREKELEAVHRGQQYVHAIRLFHLKTNAYPASVKQLEKTNNERYLRQHYLDPFTGKDDWRLIGVGQAKTTVKGFFGQPLAGLATTGLGSAAGLSSGVGGGATTGGTTGGSAFGPGNSAGAPGDSGTQGSSSSGSSSFGSSSFGQSGQTGSTGSTGTGSDSPLDGGSVGPFMGVGLSKDGNSIITLNEQTNYSTWEFIYDPRIEQLYAKSSLFGGGIATSSGGLGSASGLSSTTGGGIGTPTTPTSPTTPSDPNNPNNPNNPTPTPNPAPVQNPQ